jgi:uncharacterized protein DUF7002
MEPESFTRRFPVLYHMAEDGSWPSIKDHGLLSTAGLLDAYRYEGTRREEIQFRRRDRKIPITCPGMPGAVVRDQKPLDESRLGSCLTDDLTPRQWYGIINSKVFFWPSWSELLFFLQVREYRNLRHTVIGIPTRLLVDAHAGDVRLSSINSGSTFRDPPDARGLGTFRRLEDFPPFGTPREVAIEGGITDLLALDPLVERWIAHKASPSTPARYERLETLRPSASVTPQL